MTITKSDILRVFPQATFAPATSAAPATSDALALGPRGRAPSATELIAAQQERAELLAAQQRAAHLMKKH